MDVGTTNGWRMEDVVPTAAIVARINAAWPLAPVDPTYTGKVATRWRYVDGSGEIGVIASVTQPFCRTCTRARLSTEGWLYTCLFASQGHGLRGGTSDAEITATLHAIWRGRADRYSEIRSAHTRAFTKVEMSHIGG